MRRKILQTLLIFSLTLTSILPVNINAEPVSSLPEVELVEMPVQEEIQVVNVNIPQTTSTVIEETVEEPRFTEDEIFLIAWCMVAEAEGEPEDGKRLVIDVILNRVDSSKHADTVHGVVYAKNQFVAMHNGRAERCKDKVTEEMLQLVREEIDSRLNDRVLYFRTKHYHNFGTPEINVGGHYFSS